MKNTLSNLLKKIDLNQENNLLEFLSLNDSFSEKFIGGFRTTNNGTCNDSDNLTCNNQTCSDSKNGSCSNGSCFV